MALTASNLISAAKKRTYGARGRQKISNSMLLEELNLQDDLIVKMISQINPDLLSTVTGSATCTDSDNQNGYTLSDGIHYRDFVHVDSADDKYTPIDILQRQHRQSLVEHPAGMLRVGTASGATFYPIDPSGKRWTDNDARNWFEPDENHTFTYSFVPIPGGLTSLAGTLVGPEMAKEVYISSLELSILLSVDTARMNEVQAQALNRRIQSAFAKRQGAFDALRMQTYKFAHPAGQAAGGAIEKSDTQWVTDEVNG